MSRKQEFLIKKWQCHIRDCQESGMKIRDWCATNGISKSAYYYWLSKLRSECYATAIKQLQPGETGGHAGVASQVYTNSFIEIGSEMVCGEPSQASLIMPAAVVQKGNLRVEIMQNASASFIRHLFTAVQYA